ncbi:MAG: radical SAM protein, partial [Actinomycetota bacterium]
MPAIVDAPWRRAPVAARRSGVQLHPMANPVPEVPALADGPGRDRPLVHFVLPPPCFERPENFRAAQAPPLALLTLGALARRHGWDVRLVDAVHQPIPAERPDLVGMTVYTQNAPIAYALAGEYRDRGVPVVLGGAHASVLPGEGLRFADAVVAGEAESVLGDVLTDTAAGRLAGIYRGSWEPMTDVPGPPEYQHLARQLPRRRYPSPYVYQTARGCRFNCSFCSVIRINGRGQRRRDPATVVAHFRELAERARRPVHVFLVDDDFAADLDASAELCEALAVADLPVTFGTQTSIGIARDDEFLALARRAGLSIAYNIGLDSLSRDDLKVVNKKNRPSTYAESIERLHRHDIGVSGSLIFGIADEPLDSYRAAGSIAADLGLDTAMFNVLSPMPGTETFASLHAAGRIESYDWALFDATHCVIEPHGVDPLDLERVRVEAYRTFMARREGGYVPGAREQVARPFDELIAAHGPDDPPTWVSYEAHPDDVADLALTSAADANEAITTARRGELDRGRDG